MKKLFFFFIVFSYLFQNYLIAQDQKECIRKLHEKNANPFITNILEDISIDSLASTMQWMVDMGTRFMYAENRRDVASGIAGKFAGYGCAAVLDSFLMPGEIYTIDSVWQYNVVATLTGTSAPEEIYILSAHHDDYCHIAGDPHIAAPGADDNASGCAVALEIARVFHDNGFHPGSTIRFVTYAAEETFSPNLSGSIYYAEKIFASHEDLRLHICNDMVANTPGTGFQIHGVIDSTGKNAWAGSLSASSASLYSNLEVSPAYPSPDSFRFMKLGYPIAGLSEIGVTSSYHTLNDSVSNCNMEICLEAAKANCAMLLNEQITPVPQVPVCTAQKNGILISWKPTANNNVKKCNIYRSLSADSGFCLMAGVNYPASSWFDSTAQNNILYFYVVTTSDSLENESTPSNIISGSTASKGKPLLVIKDTKGGTGFYNPDDSIIDEYYHKIFRDLEFDYTDPSILDTLNIAVLNNYQRIFWLSNSFNDQPNSPFRLHHDEILNYLRDGGQLFISGFHPSFMIKGVSLFDNSFQPYDTISRYYKISSVVRKPHAWLNGAMNVGPEYPELSVDTAKCIPALPEYLMNIESIFPSSDASTVYLWETGYDTSTVMGEMKDKPVGIEYIGNDYKVILLSVPLFFLDSLQAKNLVEMVVNEKFKPSVGINEINPRENSTVIKCLPNPCRDQSSVIYRTEKKSSVTIEIFSLTGKRLYTSNEGIKEAGSYQIEFEPVGLTEGIYVLVLKTDYGLFSGKIVILR